MIELTIEDRNLIKSLVYQAELSPYYDEWMDCLVWDDEWPEGLSKNGIDVIDSLITARSLIHDFEKRQRMLRDGSDVEYFESFWRNSVLRDLDWPGFRREEATKEMLDILERSKKASAQRGEL